MEKFFKHDVPDVSERDGWAAGNKFDARIGDVQLTVAAHQHGDHRYVAYLHRGPFNLVHSEGLTAAEALRNLEEAVRTLRTTLERVSAP